MRKGNIDWLPLICALIRDQTHNPGMCPHWESNQQPFTLRDDAQPTEPHQSGPLYLIFKVFINLICVNKIKTTQNSSMQSSSSLNW